MDLRQKKLTKKEWEMLEVPVDNAELTILKLIKDGYTNLNICRNSIQSLVGFMKINKNVEHYFMYICIYDIVNPFSINYKKNISITKHTVKSKKNKIKKG